MLSKFVGNIVIKHDLIRTKRNSFDFDSDLLSIHWDYKLGEELEF